MRILYKDGDFGRLATIEVYYATYDELKGDSFLLLFSADDDEIIVSQRSDCYYMSKADCDALIRELYQTERLDLTKYFVTYNDN